MKLVFIGRKMIIKEEKLSKLLWQQKLDNLFIVDKQLQWSNVQPILKAMARKYSDETEHDDFNYFYDRAEAQCKNRKYTLTLSLTL